MCIYNICLFNIKIEFFYHKLFFFKQILNYFHLFKEMSMKNGQLFMTIIDCLFYASDSLS